MKVLRSSIPHNYGSQPSCHSAVPSLQGFGSGLNGSECKGSGDIDWKGNNSVLMDILGNLARDLVLKRTGQD